MRNSIQFNSCTENYEKIVFIGFYILLWYQISAFRRLGQEILKKYLALLKKFPFHLFKEIKILPKFC